MVEGTLQLVDKTIADARGACSESAILLATARAIQGDSLTLMIRAQEARGARRLHGASDLGGPGELDASLMATLISGAALCDDCLSRKTGVLQFRVNDVLHSIGRTMKLRSWVGRCGGCLGVTTVHRIA